MPVKSLFALATLSTLGKYFHPIASLAERDVMAGVIVGCNRGFHAPYVHVLGKLFTGGRLGEPTLY